MTEDEAIRRDVTVSAEPDDQAMRRDLTLPAEPDDEAIRRDVTVPAEPDEVWRAVATEEGLESWLADEVELDLREGGEAVFRYPDGEERHAVVERVDEGRRLVLRWRREGREASRVLLEVEPVPAGTRLRVVEWGLGPAASALAWAGPLDALAGLTTPEWGGRVVAGARPVGGAPAFV